MEPAQPSDEARVLVIYTGGTIGMLLSAQGYVPEPFFLTETLRSQKRFHDPLQNSLYSQAASVESGRSSPSATDSHLPDTSSISHPTLLVKSYRPIGRAQKLAPHASSTPIDDIQCEKIADDVYQARLPSFVTPRSVGPGLYDWIRIATEIELNYMDFDAFVVLHGTDTMSYSSSALKCCLYFNHTLYRGNRVSKISSYDLNAFHSPNFPPLVNVGIDIVVNWNEVLRQTNLRRFRAHKKMSPHVATLRLFPGMSDTTVRAFLAPPTRGIVLETFGAGNAPQRSDLMAALKQACDSGIVIVAITQCLKGSVSDAYKTGRILQTVGVVPGGDMTPECALAKLAYLLSKPELSLNQVRELISMPLRGELTRPTLPPPTRPPTAAPDIPSVQGLLTQFITFTPSVGSDARDAAASWSGTAKSLQFCKTVADAWDAEDVTPATIPGGVVNCLEAGSGRSPLHVATLVGNTASAARQGHKDIVDILVGAGSNLGGLECEAGYAELSMKNALNSGDQNAVEVWNKAGMKAIIRNLASKS
ncbi:asparaginase-domain-containing protein [Boletus edulis]|nr:asparaginase-domain-containing protein [Boletus edulis]